MILDDSRTLIHHSTIKRIISERRYERGKGLVQIHRQNENETKLGIKSLIDKSLQLQYQYKPLEGLQVLAYFHHHEKSISIMLVKQEKGYFLVEINSKTHKQNRRREISFSSLLSQKYIFEVFKLSWRFDFLFLLSSKEQFEKEFIIQIFQFKAELLEIGQSQGKFTAEIVEMGGGYTFDKLMGTGMSFFDGTQLKCIKCWPADKSLQPPPLILQRKRQKPIIEQQERLVTESINIGDRKQFKVLNVNKKNKNRKKQLKSSDLDRGLLAVNQIYQQLPIRNVFMDNLYCIVYLSDRTLTFRGLRNLAVPIIKFKLHVAVTAFNWMLPTLILVGNQQGSVHVYIHLKNSPLFSAQKIHSQKVQEIRSHIIDEANKTELTLSGSKNQLILWLQYPNNKDIFPVKKIPLPSKHFCLFNIGSRIYIPVVTTQELFLFFLENPSAKRRQTYDLQKLQESRNFKMLVSPQQSESVFIMSKKGDIYEKQLFKNTFQLKLATEISQPFFFYVYKDLFIAVSGKVYYDQEYSLYSELIIHTGNYRNSLVQTRQFQGFNQIFTQNGQVVVLQLGKQSTRVFVYQNCKLIQKGYQIKQVPTMISGLYMHSSNNLYLSSCGIFKITPDSQCIPVLLKPQKLFNIQVDSKETVLFASNSKGWIKIIDLVMNCQVRKFKLANNKIETLLLLPDNIIIASDDAQLIVWSQKFKHQVSKHETKGSVVISEEGSFASVLQTEITESQLKCRAYELMLFPRNWQNYSSLKKIQILKRMFSFEQLVYLNNLISRVGYINTKLILSQTSIKNFIFNAAVMNCKDSVVQFMIENQLYNYEADGIFLQQGALDYCAQNNLEKPSKLLIQKLKDKNIYNSLYYRSDKKIMSDYLSNFCLQVSSKDFQFPQYAQVYRSVQPLNSPSKHFVDIVEQRVKINSSSNNNPIRLIKFARALQTTKGSQDIQLILSSIQQYSNFQLVDSDVYILLEFLWQKHQLFFQSQVLITAMIYIVQVWATLNPNLTEITVSTILLLPLTLYQFMTFRSLRQYFNNTSNYFDIISILTLLSFNTYYFIYRETDIVLQYFSVFFSLFRIAFCLKIIQPLRHFIYIFEQIVLSILPFVVFIFAFTLLFILTGMVGRTSDQRFSVEGITAISGIYYGSVDFSNYDVSKINIKFVVYFNTFFRQLITTTFMLNGILAGMVTGNYQRLFQEKKIIFFKEKVQAVQEVQGFYSKIQMLLVNIGYPFKTQFTHLVVTDIPQTESHSSRVQQLKKKQSWLEGLDLDQGITDEEFKEDQLIQNYTR